MDAVHCEKSERDAVKYLQVSWKSVEERSYFEPGPRFSYVKACRLKPMIFWV